MSKFRAHLLSATSLSAFVAVACWSAARAADLPVAPAPFAPAFIPLTTLPAVDGLNGKLELFGGAGAAQYFDPYRYASYLGANDPGGLPSKWYGAGGGAGSISVPLQHDFGVQLDGRLADWRSQFFAAGGGHLFWRDPTRALLGVYGSGAYWGGAGGIGVGRAAGEGELYLGRFTVGGVVGAEFGGHEGSVWNFGVVSPWGAPYVASSYYDLRTSFYDHVAISAYATDNLKFSVGHVYTGRKNAAVLGAEYLLPAALLGRGTAVSAFIEGRVGERDTSAVLAGIRVYFGNSEKTLIRRHREDDPSDYTNDNLFTISNSQSNSTVGVPVPSTTTCPPGYYVVAGQCVPAFQPD